jgi:hypothetical protein
MKKLKEILRFIWDERGLWWFIAIFALVLVVVLKPQGVNIAWYHVYETENATFKSEILGNGTIYPNNSYIIEDLLLEVR